ncbi:MAG: electron transport complex subunit RsxE, partial [Victivallales bacterium]|nr:electron transport complex subunit RsxE [Victivallales bacterium]
GFGTMFGFKVLPDAVSPIQLLASPPGAFFALGVFILVVNTVKERQNKEAEACSSTS